MESRSSRLNPLASMPLVGDLAVFCVASLPMLLAIVAAMPSILARRSPTPWIAVGLLLAAAWNPWLAARFLRLPLVAPAVYIAPRTAR